VIACGHVVWVAVRRKTVVVGVMDVVVVVVVVVAEVAELQPCRLRARSTHHAKQNLAIVRWKARTVVRGG